MFLVSSEICEGCKSATHQKIPHGKAVNCAAYGCSKPDGYHCSAHVICRYFIECLKKYDLLKEPKDGTSGN
jgi:hypothetical protein